jgi:sec-independent protein translocase protein TatA
VSLGPSELLLVLLAILLLFGGKRLPEMARNLGRGLAEVRRVTFDLKRQLNSDIIETSQRPSAAETEKDSIVDKPPLPVNVNPAAQLRTPPKASDSAS